MLDAVFQSRYACSLVSAMWHEPTRRHLGSAVLPCALASAVSTSQCGASATKPAAGGAHRQHAQAISKMDWRKTAGAAAPRAGPSNQLERDRFVAGQKFRDHGNAIFEQPARLTLLQPDHDAVGG
jgi:hypothetical protein